VVIEEKRVKLPRVLKNILRGVAGILLLIIAVAIAGAVWLRYSTIPQPRESKLLVPVSQVTVTSGRGLVNINWNEVEGATGYQVLRSDKPDRDFIVAGSPWGRTWTRFPVFGYHFVSRFVPTGENYGRLPHPPFVDTNIQGGSTYYYQVRATDGSGWTSSSTPVQFQIPAEVKEPAISIRVDASRDVGPLQHKWEVMAGSENLSYLTKGDIGEHLKAAGDGLRRSIKTAHDQLGIQYVAAHGILDDTLGVYREDSSGNAVYDWSGIDKVYDILRSDGVKPYVQLTFMPKALASDITRKPSKYFPMGEYYISPPKDYAKWSALVRALASHLIERYGRDEVESWPFAVWNQPDVCMGGMVCYWSGNAEDYYKLYDYAAEALKSVDTKLRVGGPVTQYTFFIEPFLKHVTTQNYATGGTSVPLDFLDVHIYQQPTANWAPLLHRYGLSNLPVYYTEWGVRQFLFDPVNDMPYGAAWIAHNLQESIDQVASISYWTVSDYFGEPRSFFYGGTGLIGIDGVRKPRYWAYYLLHQLGTRRVALEGEGDGFGGIVTGWATHDDHGNVQVLLSNVTNDQIFADGNASLTRHVSLSLTGLLPGKKLRLRHFRIDSAHSNVYGEWEAMGKPKWPDNAQLVDLHQHDDLQTMGESADLIPDQGGQVRVDFEMPMPALSLLVLQPVE
jgi:xylan 1,4-beta-xylosidase